MLRAAPPLPEPAVTPLYPPGVRPLTMTVVSSEALAMTLSLWGHQSMSSTGAVCPVTNGWFLSTRPVCNAEGPG